jgi:hexokinase
MQKAQKTAVDFLKKHQMAHQDIDIDKDVRVLLDDMDKGLAGRDSTLAMIPTYMQVDAEVPVNKPVIVMDAGGTNFRVATVWFDDNKKPAITNFQLYPMPGIKKEVGKAEFFGIIAGYVKDVLEKSTNIGFCFSYPTEILPNKDGKVIAFSKEVKAKEVHGHIIGESLNQAIAAAKLGDAKHTVILNDTVATLLAGRDYQNRVFDGYIGFILGTGTNSCYVEKNSNITKIKGLSPTDSQIINIESGGFGKCPMGKIDVLFDKTTVNPGVHTFEKMISGAYLGPLCLIVLQTAAEEGLFSKGPAEAIKAAKKLETKDLSDFLTFPETGSNPLAVVGKKGNADDVTKLYCLVEQIVERAAKLTAINLSSAAIKSDKGKNPNRPICIVAEGTTFYHLKGLLSKVEYYLTDYLERQQQIYYDIISVDNATLIGAAIAGLTN